MINFVSPNLIAISITILCSWNSVYTRETKDEKKKPTDWTQNTYTYRGKRQQEKYGLSVTEEKGSDQTSFSLLRDSPVFRFACFRFFVLFLKCPLLLRRWKRGRDFNLFVLFVFPFHFPSSLCIRFYHWAHRFLNSILPPFLFTFYVQLFGNCIGKLLYYRIRQDKLD